MTGLGVSQQMDISVALRLLEDMTRSMATIADAVGDMGDTVNSILEHLVSPKPMSSPVDEDFVQHERRRAWGEGFEAGRVYDPDWPNAYRNPYRVERS